MSRRGDAKDVLLWAARGLPAPPPPPIKRQIIRRYGRHLSSFIETGTYEAETLLAISKDFDRLWSIELDPELYRAAVEKTRGHEHVTVLLGDSAEILPEILSDLGEPSLFWLDGHWSGGRTARGDVDSPVMAEMEAILAHPVDGHVVLIDDARMAVGRDGYPTLDELADMVSDRFEFAVSNDIVRLTPR